MSLALKSLAFLVFETVMLLAIRTNIDDVNSSETTFWLLALASATGYLLLGALGGSWLTVFVALIPALIAYLIEPSVNDPRGEIWPFGAVWLYFSVIGFFPAWIVGFFFHLVTRHGRRQPA